MALEGRLRRLEEASEGLYQTLTLPDGRTVFYTPEEATDAMSAAIHREEHRLLPHIRQMDTNHGMVGLIRALEGSHEDG